MYKNCSEYKKNKLNINLGINDTKFLEEMINLESIILPSGFYTKSDEKEYIINKVNGDYNYLNDEGINEKVELSFYHLNDIYLLENELNSFIERYKYNFLEKTVDIVNEKVNQIIYDIIRIISVNLEFMRKIDKIKFDVKKIKILIVEDYENCYYVKDDNNNFYFVIGYYYYKKKLISLGKVDILSHEFAHLLIDETIGLEYNGESGSINEGLADIYGYCVNKYCLKNNFLKNENLIKWGFGEGVFDNNEDGRIDEKDIIRKLSDEKTYPLSLEEKESKFIFLYDKNYKKIEIDEIEDKGGVHENSGIVNYFYYKCCEKIDGEENLDILNLLIDSLTNSELYINSKYKKNITLLIFGYLIENTVKNKKFTKDTFNEKYSEIILKSLEETNLNKLCESSLYLSNDEKNDDNFIEKNQLKIINWYKYISEENIFKENEIKKYIF